MTDVRRVARILEETFKNGGYFKDLEDLLNEAILIGMELNSDLSTTESVIEYYIGEMTNKESHV